MNISNTRAAKLASAAFFIGLMSASPCFAQAAPQPDVMLLVDGEKLIGHLVSADSTNVVFKSDLAGEVKVGWTKIKQLDSSGKFAIAKKGQTFGPHTDTSKVPQGAVAVTDQKVSVTGPTGTPEVVAVADTQNVIPQDSFLRGFRHPRLADYWSGAAGAGFAWVQSTQKSETLTTSLSLSRTVPSEGWIDPRYRTTISFNSAFGNTTSDGNTIRTNIIHGGLEQDQYLNKRLFAYGDVSLDHNYSQGLTVESTVGGGIGFVVYKDAHQELDLKAQIAYIDQDFSSKQTHLVGAVLGESYNRSFNRGISLHQELSVTPTFNEISDYSANFIANLGVPVGKKFNITFGIVDSYLNNPPPAFTRNSFQFVTNLTYKIH